MSNRNKQVTDQFDKMHRKLFVAIMCGRGQSRQVARRAWQLRAKGAPERVSREARGVFNDVTRRMTQDGR